MAEAASRPRRREMQARAFRIINVPMRAVLGLPFATPLSGSRIRLRGRHVEATPEVVAGVDEVDKLLAVMWPRTPEPRRSPGSPAGRTAVSTGPGWRQRYATASGSCAGTFANRPAVLANRHQ